METISSNVPGLDEILNGGFIRGRMYLVRGEPGVGKSLLGAHFLSAGLANGETVLYIHGEESRADIIRNTDALGIDLTGAEFLDLGPEAEFFTQGPSYSVVDPTDLESEQMTDDIQEVIETINPSRVFLDPITQLEYVETDQYQYRKRLLSLLRFLRENEMTVLASKTWEEGVETQPGSSDNAESISDGLVDLFCERGGRRIKVPKHRGLGQSDRIHALEIRENGLEVYPQIVPETEITQYDPALIPTGNSGLDSLLGGGIEQGSVTFLSGPTGVGKSTLATQLLVGATGSGLRAGCYLFEEQVPQFEFRASHLGYPVPELRADGSLVLAHVEPLTQSAEEFTQRVTDTVEKLGLDLVVIDGIDGYQLSLQGDRQRLISRLHALTRVLTQQDVTVVITDEISDLTGMESATSTETSYIADSIVSLSYTPEQSGLDRAIGVLKKRTGSFDSAFHYFTIEADTGLTIGEKLTDTRALFE